jgi:hypothetical protein
LPYIKEHRRKFLKEIVGSYDSPENAGELNYLFTILAKQYLEENGESYQHYNDVIGALEGAKLELYRRKVASYEDTKIEENGDVY